MKVKEMITVGGDGYSYTSGYFTANKWLNTGAVALARSRDKNIGWGSELVIFNYASRDIEVIASGLNSWLDYVVFENKIYYLSDTVIYVYDRNSHKSRALYDFGDLRLGSPHLTADGDYMSLFSYNDADGMRAYRYDIRKNELKFVFSKSFRPPFAIANHLMIDPSDENIFFFAHEGDTRYITNRLWIYDARNGSMRNIARQSLNEDGELEDCLGHEVWSHDGKGLFFVKYALSLSSPKGICYASLDEGDFEVLYSKYEYWHAGVSTDGKYLTADTTGEPGVSGVILIDMKSGEEMLIEKAPSRKSHPNHPHPSISPDNSALIYNVKIDSDTDGVRIALLED